MGYAKQKIKQTNESNASPEIFEKGLVWFLLRNLGFIQPACHAMIVNKPIL